MRTRLPSDPHDRLVAAVRRSLPSPDAPDDYADLPDKAVRLRQEARNERAVMYAGMEDLTDRCLATADAIVSSGVVLDIVSSDEDDSLVQSIDQLEETLDDEDDFFGYAASSHR